LLFNNTVIANPKKLGRASALRSIFPYYAGYSTQFAEQLLNSLELQADSVVLDPWNGGGTTTHVATKLGFASIGFDLNPVMVIVAKANLLPAHEVSSLMPIAQSILKQALAHQHDQVGEEPLREWLSPESARCVRQIEVEINKTLISYPDYKSVQTSEGLNALSSLGAFFYVVLFRTTRRLLVDFVPTNPTWIKKPKSLYRRKRPTFEKIQAIFLNEIDQMGMMLQKIACFPRKNKVPIMLGLGNAESLALTSNSVDAVITSPPYCTRIDYAVATAIELAVLRFSNQNFQMLRKSLMGTSTVEAKNIKISALWGNTCAKFLSAVYCHSSKASQTYYYKNHLQYFNSLFESVKEISRVLKPEGACFLVVQDSYYKDIHNDVPTITSEMAAVYGLDLLRKDNFVSNRSMVGLNHKAKKYLKTRQTIESVLCFRKT